MHRFYQPGPEFSQRQIPLPPEEVHHALHVLRLREGEPVAVMNGQGEVAYGVLRTENRQVASVMVERRERRPRPRPQMVLFQGVTKRSAFEWILQKAVEMGVSRFVPVLTEHAVPSWDPREVRKKQERWEAIAIGAMKQSGNPWRMQVDSPKPFPQALEEKGLDDEEPVLRLVALLEEEAQPLRVWLQRFRAEKGTDPETVHLWIGPEGDFSSWEKDQLRQRQVHPLTLGPYTLRAETAALTALAHLSYELRLLSRANL